jgi:hypothetical protein
MAMEISYRGKIKKITHSVHANSPCSADGALKLDADARSAEFEVAVRAVTPEVPRASFK